MVDKRTHCASRIATRLMRAAAALLLSKHYTRLLFHHFYYVRFLHY